MFIVYVLNVCVRYTCGVKDNFWETVLSCHYIVSGDQIEVFKLDKYLYLRIVIYLTDPKIDVSEISGVLFNYS